MASVTTTSKQDDCESCALCSSKYNRTRTSFCQCKHCSMPLCLDCMKEHHEELLQDVAQISHLYNELQQLLQTKQMMIVEETAKSIETVNRYFDVCIDELGDTQRKIIVNMERAKQDAQDHLRKLGSDLRSLGGEIQGLAKESIVQTNKTKHVSIELKKIEQQLGTYEVRRTENLSSTQPDFSIKFDSLPVEIETPRSTNTEMKEISQTGNQQSLFNTNTFSMFHQFPSTLEYPINKKRKGDDGKDEPNNSSMSDDDETDEDDNHIDTTSDVGRMASDGKNILYTSYRKKKSDIIAYCLVDDDEDDTDDDDDDDDDDDNDDDADEHEDWNHSRIVDMIWWGSIKKFICATEKGIYTVDYANKNFEITSVIDGKWSFIRVGANTTHLFTWINSIANDFRGIEVYSPKFDQIRKIDFDKCRTESLIKESISFCVTDKFITSVCTHQQNNRETLQVIFSDMDMNKLNTISLDKCNRNIEIRTDGKDRFFITTGQRTFYIIVPPGAKKMINLQYNGKWIAVLNNRHVGVSNGRTDIELVPY